MRLLQVRAACFMVVLGIVAALPARAQDDVPRLTAAAIERVGQLDWRDLGRRPAAERQAALASSRLDEQTFSHVVQLARELEESLAKTSGQDGDMIWMGVAVTEAANTARRLGGSEQDVERAKLLARRMVETGRFHGTDLDIEQFGNTDQPRFAALDREIAQLLKDGRHPWLEESADGDVDVSGVFGTSQLDRNRQLVKRHRRKLGIFTGSEGQLRSALAGLSSANSDERRAALEASDDLVTGYVSGPPAPELLAALDGFVRGKPTASGSAPPRDERVRAARTLVRSRTPHDYVANWLASDDAATRGAALAALDRLPSGSAEQKSALEAALRGLASPPYAEQGRAAAIRALGSVDARSSETLDLLAATAVNDTSDFLRGTALNALARPEAAPVAGRVAELLGSGGALELSAAACLGAIGPAGFAAANARCASGPPQLRLLLLDIALAAAQHDVPGRADAARYVLDARSDPDAGVARRAGRAAASLPPEAVRGTEARSEQVLADLRSRDFMRVHAAAQLIQASPESYGSSAPVLAELLGDEQLAMAAAPALGKLRDPAALPSLIARLDPEESLGVTTVVMQAIGEYGALGRPALPRLRELADGVLLGPLARGTIERIEADESPGGTSPAPPKPAPPPSERPTPKTGLEADLTSGNSQRIGRALSQLSDDTSKIAALAPTLVAVAESGPAEMRLAAAHTLIRVGDARAVGPLVKLLGSTDEKTQLGALGGLGQLGPKAKSALPALRRMRPRGMLGMVVPKIIEKIEGR